MNLFFPTTFLPKTFSRKLDFCLLTLMNFNALEFKADFINTVSTSLSIFFQFGTKFGSADLTEWSWDLLLVPDPNGFSLLQPTKKSLLVTFKSARERYVKRTETEEAPKSDWFLDLCYFTGIRQSSQVAMSKDQDSELYFYVRCECRGNRRTTPMFLPTSMLAEMSLEVFRFNIVNGIPYLKSQKGVKLETVGPRWGRRC